MSILDKMDDMDKSAVLPERAKGAPSTTIIF